MKLQEHITTAWPNDKVGSGIPTFIRMRDITVVPYATEFLIAKSEGLLRDIYQYSNDFYGMRIDLRKYDRWRLPSPLSVKGYCNHLAYFLRWAEAKGEDIDDYEKYDLSNITGYAGTEECGSVEEYANDMRNGVYGDVSSVHLWNERIELVNEFFLFLHHEKSRDARPALVQPFVPYYARKPRNDFSRPDKPAKNRDYVIPRPSAIRAWLDTLTEEDRLMAELAVFSGLRNDDITMLLFDDIQFKEDRQVMDDRDHDRVTFNVYNSKYGKDYQTTMPLKIWQKLHAYCKHVRAKRLHEWGVKSDFVFVSTIKRDGSPFTKNKIARIFADSPFGKAWTPHQGRHSFAVYRLVELMMNTKNTLDVGADITTQAMIHQAELGILQQEMGHSHPETCQTYLRWGQRRLGEFDEIYKELHNNEG